MKLLSIILIGLMFSTTAYSKAKPVRFVDNVVIPVPSNEKDIKDLGLLTGIENANYNAKKLADSFRFIIHSANKVHYKLPAGKTYYIGKPAAQGFRTNQQRYAKNSVWTLRIPKGTVLKATKGIHNSSMILFTFSDMPNFDNIKICFYGGKKCSPTDKTLGGTIDNSLSTFTSVNNHRPYHGNNNIFTINGVNTLVVQGLTLKGSSKVSDTALAGVDGTVRIRNTVIDGFSDSATYFNGSLSSSHRELSKSFMIHSSKINNTMTGVTCKRGLSLCEAYNNVFTNNGNGVACMNVGDTHTDNPFPCNRMIVKGNTFTRGSGNGTPSWRQAVGLDWCVGCTVTDNEINGYNLISSVWKQGPCGIRVVNSGRSYNIARNTGTTTKVCDSGSVYRMYGNIRAKSPTRRLYWQLPKITKYYTVEKDSNGRYTRFYDINHKRIIDVSTARSLPRGETKYQYVWVKLLGNKTDYYYYIRSNSTTYYYRSADKRYISRNSLPKVYNKYKMTWRYRPVLGKVKPVTKYYKVKYTSPSSYIYVDAYSGRYLSKSRSALPKKQGSKPIKWVSKGVIKYKAPVASNTVTRYVSKKYFAPNRYHYVDTYTKRFLSNGYSSLPKKQGSKTIKWVYKGVIPWPSNIPYITKPVKKKYYTSTRYYYADPSTGRKISSGWHSLPLKDGTKYIRWVLTGTIPYGKVK